MSRSEAAIPPFSGVCRELLEAGITIRFAAPGSSMHPTIRDGDEVEVARIRSDELREGDIALYESSGGRLICHRIVRIDQTGSEPAFIFRGEAPRAGEDRTAPAQILGVALAAQRGGRRRRLRGRVARLRQALRRWAGRVHGLFLTPSSQTPLSVNTERRGEGTEPG